MPRRNARGGRSAAEHLIAALRCLYKHAEEDGFINERDNPARKVAKPRRLPSTRRAVADTRLAEINQVAATTGDDPELDTLILRLHTETACRRGGALALRPADLDREQCLVLLREKGETVRWQPVSPTLMAALVRHAEERHAPPDGRLLRYADGRPVTYRRYDGLWVRIGRHLPWVRTQQVSTHWIRHTTLTWVERNFGFAVAHAYAGHTDGTGDTGSATSTYVRATLTEVATALAALTGEPHPLAEPAGGQAGQHQSDHRRRGTPRAYGRHGCGPGPVLDGDRTGRRPGAVPGPSELRRSLRFVWRPDLPAVPAAAAYLCAGMVGLHSIEPGDDFLDGQARVDHGNRPLDNHWRLSLVRGKRKNLPTGLLQPLPPPRPRRARAVDAAHVLGRVQVEGDGASECQAAGVGHSEHMSAASSGGMASRNLSRAVSLSSASPLRVRPDCSLTAFGSGRLSGHPAAQFPDLIHPVLGEYLQHQGAALGRKPAVLVPHRLSVTDNRGQLIHRAGSGLDVHVQLRQLLLAALILHGRVKLSGLRVDLVPWSCRPVSPSDRAGQAAPHRVHGRTWPLARRGLASPSRAPRRDGPGLPRLAGQSWT